MIKKFHLRRNFNPGMLMLGLFLFLFKTTAEGASAVRYSVSEAAGTYIMSIVAYSLEPFKTSTVKIKYSSGVDIANASIATSVKSLSVGASIDEENKILDINIFQTKKTSIDNMVLISLKFPSRTSVVASDMTIIEALFTDYNDSTFNIQVSPDVYVRHLSGGRRNSYASSCEYYLLSGRKVSDALMVKRELPLNRHYMNLRILQKVDMHYECHIRVY